MVMAVQGHAPGSSPEFGAGKVIGEDIASSCADEQRVSAITSARA